MGFDNESIVNIQSLAGEYFCPVCRTLVYPNEALQSQCTHLYCKPCLTYVVATTKACPYDGYLVTEADSKPLVESNKALAEVIGKIPVHCLFHRSGCSWQGSLSECTSHCSGCAFGNSPVVCNRCGIQIVHRLVQEHAQNCPATNPQAQDAQQNAESLKDYAMSGTITITNSSQTSQAQVSQTTKAPPPAQDSNQANTNPQVQGIASAAGTTAGQWYPQQFQQYYQQFPGYDPYQQYYPYQQPTTHQLQQQAPHVAGQPQVFAQHQTAIQPHPQPLPQVQGQPQSYPQPQMQPQMQPQPQPYPQSQQQQTSQHQLQIPPQGQPQAHSHVQNQVNPQHQSHPVIQPQLQSHSQPPVQGQNPQQLAYPQLQTHLFPKYMQPPGQQNFQAPLYQQTQSQGHQGQPQMQPQPHSHMQPLLPSHAQTQNHPHPLQPNNPQNQHPATTHVVPGHQSHQPIQPDQQMLPGAPQHHHMYMHPSTESLPPTAQFPPESPRMRPPQASASMPNQQPNLMHSQGQLQGFPPVQHQQILSQTQQGPGFQGPVVQPMQQPIQQYGQHPYPLQTSGLVQGPSHQQLPYAQHPMHTHSRPQVPTQSLQHGDVSIPPPPPHSGVQAPGMPPHQSQTYAGRPAAPNNAMPPQQFQQSGGAFGVAAQSRSIQPGSVQTSGNQNFEGGVSNQQQVPPGQQLSQSGQADKHTLHEGNAAGQEAGSASKRTAGNDVSRGAGRESVVVKPLGSQTCEKNGDEEHRAMNELENIGANGILDKDTDAEVNAVKLGFSEPPATTFVEEDANRNLGGGNEVKTAILGEKDSSVVGLKQVKNSSAEDSNVRALENISSQEQVKPQRLAVDEFGTFQDKGVINSSNPGPLTDQGKHHLPSGTSESSTHQQRLAMPSNFQSGPYPGAPPNALLPVQGPAQIRSQGPGILAPPHQSVYPSEHFQQSSYSNDIPFGGPVAPGLTTSFGQGTGQPVHRHESFELSGAQRGQQYQNNPPSQPVFSRTFSGEPVRGGPLHGPDGAAMLQNQRTNLYEGRYSDHSVSGTFDRGQYAQPPVNDNRAPGFHTASGLRAKNVYDDHRNPFVVGPTGHLDQGEYPEAPKQIPKPSIMGVEPSLNFRNGFSSGAGDYSSHDLNYDTPSKFLPPYNLSGGFHPNDIGERPSGFQENHRVRGDSARTQLDFLNRIPPRSPGREYHGIPSRGSGPSGGLQSQSGIDDIHGRDTRTVNEGSRSFYMSSDSVGKPFRGDMVGQDFIPNQLRMGETFGPRDLPSHIRRGDGFGTFVDPHMGELTGPGGLPRNDSFAGNKSNHPRLGEPGFRSSYSLHGFPSDGGFYAGKFDSFDRFKASMGWCRICKVDCSTVEGLDLHSQTMEHQQRTMDMVISIKQQNAKRQKTSKDHSSTGEGSRSRNARNRGRGKKA